MTIRRLCEFCSKELPSLVSRRGRPPQCKNRACIRRRRQSLPLKRPCAHCGTVFRPKSRQGRFCRQVCAVLYGRRGLPQTERSRISRRDMLRKKYGITLEDYQNLFEAQDGVCALCGNSCGSGRLLAVDHDHTTGKIRGLLCMAHNTGLGKFGDSSALLRKAADYLDNGGS